MKPLAINHLQSYSGISRLTIHQKLQRILQLEKYENVNDQLTDNAIHQIMITKVVAKPNPFLTSITLDVACEQSKHVIVRMFDMDEKIVKMFSWFLVKGLNVTTINEMENLKEGSYQLDIVDLEGELLYTTQLAKTVK